MGFYSKHIFPRLLDWSLGNPQMGKYRRRALEPAAGKVLEVGFGTGLNLPYYPEAVTEITALDSERMLEERVARRVKESVAPVTFVQLDAGGRLPFADGSFDTVVTTFTLCSIARVAEALAEMRRVLKADGRYVFLEHGRSDVATVARWQDRLNPLQKVIGVGCNMNRRVDGLIKENGFAVEHLERFLLPKTPRLLAEMYKGTARHQ